MSGDACLWVLKLKRGSAEPIEIKADAEYPAWLWELRLGAPPELDELDPRFLPYWRRVDELYATQLRQRKFARFLSPSLQRLQLAHGPREIFDDRPAVPELS